MGEVLVSARGQVDNLGDSVLRRGLLRALRPAGDLVVNVVGMPAGYRAGLGLGPSDRLVADAGAWGPLLARGLLRGGFYAYNAGETYADPAYARHCLGSLPLLLAGRLRGGHAVHTGFGIRAPHPVWGRAVRIGLAACDEVSWRDTPSRDAIGVGNVAPDWAYAEGAPSGDVERAADLVGRDVLAVSLRFDRPLPDDGWVAAVRAAARSRGLTIVALPQVGRDSERAELLARRLGGDLLAWDGQDHAAREEVVRAVLRRSSMVVSDRLHALVLGHTEGALPVGFGTAGVEKLARTLATVGAADVAFHQGEVTSRRAVQRIDEIDAQRVELLGCVRPARERLDALGGRILALATSGAAGSRLRQPSPGVRR
ncbi:hypothetical protein [Pengzhenrongella sicca]|uniref:Polysaccharide pyruvyl transferase domain-containing protein n=1 Tax=Pengzhenrongella sicca TaxID=2819238 RepID=A0A8A4ZBX7_9MICO|nr:hypothetical protein [Pengzhenrongella sicca]QTE28905.1 hypothetical protein J4E96_16485 [Pengzhenrongella sicca]